MHSSLGFVLRGGHFKLVGILWGDSVTFAPRERALELTQFRGIIAHSRYYAEVTWDIYWLVYNLTMFYVLVQLQIYPGFGFKTVVLGQVSCLVFHREQSVS